MKEIPFQTNNILCLKVARFFFFLFSLPKNPNEPYFLIIFFSRQNMISLFWEDYYYMVFYLLPLPLLFIQPLFLVALWLEVHTNTTICNKNTEIQTTTKQHTNTFLTLQTSSRFCTGRKNTSGMEKAHLSHSQMDDFDFFCFYWF